MPSKKKQPVERDSSADSLATQISEGKKSEGESVNRDLSPLRVYTPNFFYQLGYGGSTDIPRPRSLTI